MASEENDPIARVARKSNKSRKVRNYRWIKDKRGNPALYIYNYEGEGFSIISGDERTLPVLAYSDSGNIPSSDEELPCGLKFWINSTQEEIYTLRTANEKEAIDEYKWEWDFMKKPKQSLENAKLDPPDDEPPPPSTFNPIMRTTWGQGCGYNDYTNYCSSSSNCYLSFWIDWGWNGRSNGWFRSGNWSPGSKRYVHDKKMLIIRP